MPVAQVSLNPLIQLAMVAVIRPNIPPSPHTRPVLCSDPMQVPYAEKWRNETDRLRSIALDCGLVEETKWGKPCFTFRGKNVVIIIPLKDTCSLSFFKGALLEDPKRLLLKAGQHTQAGRWIKFSSLEQITSAKPILKTYIQEAIAIEKAGEESRPQEALRPTRCPRNCKRDSMPARSCVPHSKPSRPAEESPTVSMYRTPSKPRLEPRGPRSASP